MEIHEAQIAKIAAQLHSRHIERRSVPDLDILGSSDSIIDGVLEEFIELSEIPHSSGNEWQSSNYYMVRLKELGLMPKQDENYNIICDVPATSGLENAPLVILQGHMDMVCAVAPEGDYDPKTDGILAIVMDGCLRSNGVSSLGADCGIGNAAVLFLVSKHTAHGPLRLIFTVQEEIGLLGAQALDPKYITDAKFLINVDGFNFGDIVISGAGGKRETFTRKLETVTPRLERCVSVRIGGFLGGHSGYDINRVRANAIKHMGAWLDELKQIIPIELAGLSGGTAHNVIPAWCTAQVVIRSQDYNALMEHRDILMEKLGVMYEGTDSGGYIEITPRSMPRQVWTDECASAVLDMILLIQNGVYSMHNFVPDRVSSSSNLGRVYVNERGRIELSVFIRCAVDANEEIIAMQHTKVAAMTGFEISSYGYKGWPGRLDNRLADLMDMIYERFTGRRMNITATHAGLEPSIFHQMNPNLVMVSVGMSISNPHSLEEHVDIKTIPPFVRLLRGTLLAIGALGSGIGIKKNES